MTSFSQLYWFDCFTHHLPAVAHKLVGGYLDISLCISWPRMTSKQGGNQIVYVQDVLPPALKDLFKEPDYDIDKALLYQIKVVANCKKTLMKKRMSLIRAIGDEYIENSYERCGPFNVGYLRGILKDVEKDEVEVRRKVLGEQESVEMFKTALASDLVSEDYLSAARAYRDNMTNRLRTVVEAREILLIAIEILSRLPGSHNAQFDVKMENLKTAYNQAKEAYQNEQDLLQRLTEWKQKPDMYITDGDEFFTFFDERMSADSIDEQDAEQSSAQRSDSELASALEFKLQEQQKLVQFKTTKVDHVDSEFKMLADLAYDILRHDETIKNISSYFQEQVKAHNPKVRTCAGISEYVANLRTKYPKLKIKVSTKGYNFSLKTMRKTKSVMSLAMLSTLLDAVHEMPDEILEAQEKVALLSNSVKRVCSMHGRCSMAFNSIISKEKELDAAVRETPRVDYAESLRISGHFASNMKEVRRVQELVENMKRTVDSILEDVVAAASDTKSK